MKTLRASGLVEFRLPQHGPAALTAPEEDNLEIPIKNLLERTSGLVLRLKHLSTIPNREVGSTSTNLTDQVGDSLEDVVLRKTDIIQEKDRFLVLQQWEGFVTEVGFDFFGVKLIDLTAGKTNVSEEAELPISDLSEDDRKILQEGAVLRWLIGYRISPHGTRQRFSSIFLRRVAGPTEDRISEIRREASKLAASIRWE
jgi:hypothetical protein